MSQQNNPELRQRIRKAFQLRAFTLKKNALECVIKHVVDFNREKQDQWLQRVLAALSRQNLTIPILSSENIEEAFEICSESGQKKRESVLTVFNLFSSPRFEYDDQCEKLVKIQSESSVIGRCVDALNIYRNRLKFVLQRTLHSSSFENFELTPVEALLAAPRRLNGLVVIAMLSQRSPKHYEIEDLTGTIDVDLSGAEFHSGLYTDGCIMLMEGDCYKRKFWVTGIGLPPIESAAVTRARLGCDNWFGGTSTTAFSLVPKLKNDCEKNSNAKLVVLSDVWLDDKRVLKGIHKILTGFARSPPAAFIFCGNFCSKFGIESSYQLIGDGFRHLGNTIAEVLSYHASLAESEFIFVPGPDDPSLSSLLPRPSLPAELLEYMKKVPKCTFASNPCRMQYANQEIVILRNDLIEKMCRNSIHMPSSTADIAEHFCRTIASAGHLSPLPLSISPIVWQMDAYLMLYPLPDLVIIADQFQEFHCNVNGCLFANPSSFSRTDLSFLVYYPATRVVEPSSVEND